MTKDFNECAWYEKAWRNLRLAFSSPSLPPQGAALEKRDALMVRKVVSEVSRGTGPFSDWRRGL
ncbi:MAG: hypothetical protein COB76_05145 [Alphaproteobacteria bacterium]|nr:MAG: hypothetical protein COB76_05145 [Alphaproteobacteria bacterium]